MNTQEKILDRALEMFNERGIEYVGLRELAGVLGMRVSNITYYFPTKDDLVHHLSQEMSRRNSLIVIDKEELTLHEFMAMMEQVFENHYHFRCLLRSFVHIMTQNKLVLASYKKVQVGRRATIASNLHRLAEGGYLEVKNEEVMNFLVSNLSMISRYWISEAAVFGAQLSKEVLIRQNLEMIKQLFMPYASARGRNALASWQDTVNK